MGLSLALHVFPVTLSLVLWLVVAFARLSIPGREVPAAQLYGCLAPLAGTIVIPALGWALADHGRTASSWPLVVLGVQFLASVILLFLWKGNRGFLSAAFALELWISGCMWFIAGMSISGDWL